MCTDTKYGSVFRFVEIFAQNEYETAAPGVHYLVSWSLGIPYAEMSGSYSYFRRPECAVSGDECSDANIVHHCNERPVDLKKGMVRTSDRVYFVPPALEIGGCKLNDACCPYINTRVSGICNGKKKPFSKNL